MMAKGTLIADETFAALTHKLLDAARKTRSPEARG
jgi:hypothetical protein